MRVMTWRAPSIIPDRGRPGRREDCLGRLKVLGEFATFLEQRLNLVNALHLVVVVRHLDQVGTEPRLCEIR